ncbi:unnamed protein product [Prunus brigantina]
MCQYWYDGGDVNSGLNCKNCEMKCEGQVTSEVKDKNKYIVVGFNEVHNHAMTTVDKVHLLRSHHHWRT